MPASTTPLTVVGPSSSPAGAAFNEQNSDASPGSNFLNARGTLLYARNTTASPITLIFEADVLGVERTVMTVDVPGSGTEHGVAIIGPFPAHLFNDHSTTTSSGADQGKVYVRHAGADADIVLCPFVPNLGLAT
jgi:hypothetical protein